MGHMSLLMSVAISSALSQTPAVVVGGSVCRLIQNGNSLSYAGISMIKLEIFRRNAIDATTSGVDGRYDFSMVSAGPPILLYVDANGLVPDYKNLVADPARKQEVHIVLMTKDQYIEHYGRDALRAHYVKLLDLLKGIEGTGEYQQAIRERARREDFRLPK